MQTVTSEYVIIFANGSFRRGPAVDKILNRIQEDDVKIIAADGGADHALSIDLQPHIVIGDMDSVTEKTLTHLADAGVDIRRHSPRKNETDLELALLAAVELGARWIWIMGGIGNRVDQSYGNISLLHMEELNDVHVRLVTPYQTLWVATPGDHPIHGDVGDTVSLLPFNVDVEDIHTTGLEYPLQGETLFMGPARGMSNVLMAETAHVKFSRGDLLIVHTVGEL